jgi:hypothetical protein
MSAMNSSHTGTPPKDEKEDDESDIDLTMFDSDDDTSSLTQMIVTTTLKR